MWISYKNSGCYNLLLQCSRLMWRGKLPRHKPWCSCYRHLVGVQGVLNLAEFLKRMPELCAMYIYQLIQMDVTSPPRCISLPQAPKVPSNIIWKEPLRLSHSCSPAILLKHTELRGLFKASAYFSSAAGEKKEDKIAKWDITWCLSTATAFEHLVAFILALIR